MNGYIFVSTQSLVEQLKQNNYFIYCKRRVSFYED